MGKEMSLIIGDANVGKSLVATFIGGQAVRQLRKTLHVTLEMSKARTLIRYFTTLAEPDDKITYGQIFNFNPEDHVFNYVNRLKDTYENYLKVEEFPSGKCSIDDLYRLLDKYPDTELLIVDYLDLMKPVRKRDNFRHEMADLTTALRGLACESDSLHVMSPTQTNRLASGKRIIGKEYVGEDYNKIRIADWAIGIGQNSHDVQKHEIIFNIARSRNSEKAFAERYFIDFNTMRFKFLMQENMLPNANAH